MSEDGSPGVLVWSDPRVTDVGRALVSRPVPEEDLVGSVCQVREYTFDKNGNRTALARRTAVTGGACGTGTVVSTTSVYDAADRLTAGYIYDALGRVTTLPAADSPAAAAGTTGAGAISLADDHNDQIRSITQDGTATTFTLDQAGRRASEATATGEGAKTQEVSSRKAR